MNTGIARHLEGILKVFREHILQGHGSNDSDIRNYFVVSARSVFASALVLELVELRDRSRVRMSCFASSAQSRKPFDVDLTKLSAIRRG